MPILIKIFHNIEAKEIFPNSFYKAIVPFNQNYIKAQQIKRTIYYLNENKLKKYSIKHRKQIHEHTKNTSYPMIIPEMYG